MTTIKSILVDRIELDLIERLAAVRAILEQSSSETALTDLLVLGGNALREAINYLVEQREARHRVRVSLDARNALCFAKLEDVAQAFLKKHPIGSLVTPDCLLEFAASDQANGIKHDLLIDNARMQISAIRRHLNLGGRFYLGVKDAERKTFIVQNLNVKVMRHRIGP